MTANGGFEDIGHARVDVDRLRRQGMAEAVYGEGKTAPQIAEILRVLQTHGQVPALVTRLDAAKAAEVASALGAGAGFEYFPEARLGRLGKAREADGAGTVVVASAGTSDLPVAEEAALTAETLGNRVRRLADVGVAGLHRLLAERAALEEASVLVVVAGMEGALASVAGGLAACPVVAVPTSVGYGAAFEGLSALLGMINSCAAGVAVVNIDNGFGAGVLAHRINHVGRSK
ncbi:MAG: nickel pincer cofactor biosynthesis protein LarB [Kiritimatiellae bacterium]|nr:nickel pincer cofactor biosynthesis protein LarB [Kiritimatiellia bacterium]